jgi:hypothetical protein
MELKRKVNAALTTAANASVTPLVADLLAVAAHSR